jgi:hypothetical protein
MENMIDKIRKEIEKSGFPLELYALDICSKKNTGRMPNLRYTYKEELREVDLYAFLKRLILILRNEKTYNILAPR